MAKTKKVQAAEDTLREYIDELYRKRERRLEINRQAEALKTEEQMIRELIIKNLQALGLTSLQGKIAYTELRMKSVPSVADWDALYEHIRRTGEFDLIHRRITDTAVRARWESGDEVPGVERTDVVDISLGKLK